jgi:hypothetical protein
MDGFQFGLLDLVFYGLDFFGLWFFRIWNYNGFLDLDLVF